MRDCCMLYLSAPRSDSTCTVQSSAIISYKLPHRSQLLQSQQNCADILTLSLSPG